MALFDLYDAVWYLEEVFKDKVDSSHGVDHALAVLDHTVKALKCESTLDDDTKRQIVLASLLHDADDHKYFPDNQHYQNARSILSKLNVNEKDVEKIVEMIALVSVAKNGNSIPEKEWMLIPRYSDRLEAIGKIGILRCYLYNLVVKRPLYTTETLRATTLEELSKIATVERFNNYVNLKGKVGESTFIDHFYDKLLHFTDFGSNEYLLSEGENRLKIMQDYVLDFGRSGTVDIRYLEGLRKYGTL